MAPRSFRVLGPALLNPALLLAQTPTAFEVASIKPDPWPGRNTRVGIAVQNDTLTGDHIDLYSLVEFAYDLKPEHISGGPPWAKHGMLDSSELYFVVAKAAGNPPGNPPPPQSEFRRMLQTLLAERFHLELRHAAKDFPIFNLTAGPRLKLKESAPDAKFGFRQDARLNHGHAIRATATHTSMAQFVSILGSHSGRPMYDHTGLTGFYDFELSWDTDDSADSTGPDAIGQLFGVAVEKQLGLKLESATASFDTVVIERAEKPTAN